ncbi:MAG TPA: 2-oxo-4-hydroxy-4-carboxy-5-ureidoimidazoline decarboxylase [Microlunatus sp.]|nr:2-oxo-4-hydroxy-4-carboxy-5-ureidoimidazoline decarboxylase [Microlunatus sp.]
MPSLTDFNAADRAGAVAAVRPCLDIDRWVDAVVDGRPYGSVDDALSVASTAADAFTDDELAQALRHHPRIGEPADGADAEASLSRSEQAGVSTDAELRRRLAEGNRAYEQRFGQVFLIRAAGRSAAQILDALEERLAHDPATEKSIMVEQLREIALLRLEGMLR